MSDKINLAETQNSLSEDDLAFSIDQEMQKLDIVLEEGWKWRLTRVKSGKEFVVQKKLEEEYSNVIAAVFIPFTISSIKRGAKIVKYKKIIHPGYIYCLCKKEGYHEALRTVYKQLEILLYIVSDKKIDLQQVKKMCNMAKENIITSLFHKGDSVQILSGIWKDCTGIVIDISDTTVKIQLDNLNKTFVDCDIVNVKLNKGGI